MYGAQSTTFVGHHLNILLLLGVAIFLAAIGGKLFQRLHIPQVVGYIVTGLAVGQTGLGLIAEEVVAEMRPMSMFALGLIGFMIGGEIIIVVTATTLLVELLGPPFVKLAVKKAGEVGLGVREEDLIRSYTVADVMDRNPPLVRAKDRLQRVLEVISSDDAHLYYPVVDDRGGFQGVISLEHVKPVLRDQAAVSDILVAYDLMAHCDETVTRELPLQRALSHMREARLQFLPVIEKDGVKKLVGFLDRRAVERFLSTELLRRRQAAGG